MSWIWQKYSKDNKFVINGKINPYSEIFEDYSNEKVFYVNVMQRFSEIFFNIVEPESENEYLNDEYNTIENEKEIFSQAVHFLAKLDMLNGISYIEIACDLIRSEIKNGAYGKEIRDLFFSDCLNEHERKRILMYMYNRNEQNQNESLLIPVFMEFFNCIERAVYKGGSADKNSSDLKNPKIIIGFAKPCPEVYYRKSNETFYYYFGGSEENQKNIKKFRLIKLLFADVEENIVDVWGKCFGIIGETNIYAGAYPEINQIRLI